MRPRGSVIAVVIGLLVAAGCSDRRTIGSVVEPIPSAAVATPRPTNRTLTIPTGRPFPGASVEGCDPSVTEYATGLGKSEYGMHLASGPDGGVWFVHGASGSVGRISGTGDVWTEKLANGARPVGIASDRRGAMWITDAGRVSLWRLAMNGRLTEHKTPTRDGNPMGVPSEGAFPRGIVLGPDGAMWFTEMFGDNISRISDDGKIAEYPLPDRDTLHAHPSEITVGGDRKLWFTRALGAGLGTIDPGTKAFGEEVRVPGAEGGTAMVGTVEASGEDIWFTDGSTHSIGVGRRDGRFEKFALPTPGAEPDALTRAADGGVWFTEVVSNKIGRVDATGKLAFFEGPSAKDVLRGGDITTGPDGAVWFTEPGAGKIGRLAC